jgi:hypothetical protein
MGGSCTGPSGTANCLRGSFSILKGQEAQTEYILVSAFHSTAKRKGFLAEPLKSTDTPASVYDVMTLCSRPVYSF